MYYTGEERIYSYTQTGVHVLEFLSLNLTPPDEDPGSATIFFVDEDSCVFPHNWKGTSDDLCDWASI